jgi:phage tail-like protein
MADIPAVFHFRVEVAGFSDDQDIRFQEVTGLSAEVSTEEFREGGLNQYAHRIPTGAKYGNLVLKRGYVEGSALIDWCRKAVEDFSFEPKDLTVSLLDPRHEPLVTWSFTGAYPAKWSVSDLKAQESALAIESLELVYQSFRKV